MSYHCKECEWAWINHLKKNKFGNIQLIDVNDKGLCFKCEGQRREAMDLFEEKRKMALQSYTGKKPVDCSNSELMRKIEKYEFYKLEDGKILTIADDALTTEEVFKHLVSATKKACRNADLIYELETKSLDGFEEWQEKALKVDDEGITKEIRRGCFNGNGLLMDPCIDTFEECWTTAANHREKETKELKHKATEAVNTTWRFIGAYKKENSVPIEGALKSCEYHLGQLDYLFEETS